MVVGAAPRIPEPRRRKAGIAEAMIAEAMIGWAGVITRVDVVEVKPPVTVADAAIAARATWEDVTGGRVRGAGKLLIILAVPRVPAVLRPGSWIPGGSGRIAPRAAALPTSWPTGTRPRIGRPIRRRGPARSVSPVLSRATGLVVRAGGAGLMGEGVCHLAHYWGLHGCKAIKLGQIGRDLRLLAVTPARRRPMRKTQNSLTGASS